MYEAIEHWNQYKQEPKKYPTKQELIVLDNINVKQIK